MSMSKCLFLSFNYCRIVSVLAWIASLFTSNCRQVILYRTTCVLVLVVEISVMYIICSHSILIYVYIIQAIHIHIHFTTCIACQLAAY